MADLKKALEALEPKKTEHLTVVILDHKSGEYTVQDCESLLMVTAQTSAVHVRGTISRYTLAGRLGTNRCIEMFMNLVKGMAKTFPETRASMGKALQQALIGSEKDGQAENTGS